MHPIFEQALAPWTPPPAIDRAAKIEALLREVLSMIEDGDPPSPSGDWATETRKLLWR